MATTTNYSWTTPDDTDLVKDGASAIRTLGSSADTTVKDLNPGTTAGDIDYYTSATAKARIGIGTAGQVLQVNAGATAPEWAAPAGGGKVLQVVSATTTTATTIANTALQDTGITATITPTLATSKILVLVSAQFHLSRDVAFAYAAAELKRDATTIMDYDQGDTFEWAAVNATGATSGRLVVSASIVNLDSPATTSATTYKLQARTPTTANSNQIVFQFSTAPSTITLLEIGV
jgi:hypothetical protein